MPLSNKDLDNWFSPSKENLPVYTFFQRISHIPKMLKRELYPDQKKFDLGPIHTLSYGANQGKGNIVALQPMMQISDYTKVSKLYQKCEACMLLAQTENWFDEKTIVVFPEHIGTWLISQGEIDFIYQCEEWQSALQWLAVSHPVGMVKQPPKGSETKDIINKVFEQKARRMAHQYHLIFSRLARSFGVTIVAGSIVLPSPTLSGGMITTENGPLRNISAIYKPSGELYESLVYEKNLAPFEQTFLSESPASINSTFETPAGKMAIILGYDATKPVKPWEYKDISILLNPTFQLDAQETWLDTDHALVTPFYLSTHFRGQIWDLHPQGNSQICGKTSQEVIPYTNDTTLFFNSWLPFY